MKTRLRALIEQGIASLRQSGSLPADLATPDFTIERPRERSHGDFSSNAAMLVAGQLGKRGQKANPRAIAQATASLTAPSTASNSRSTPSSACLAVT